MSGLPLANPALEAAVTAAMRDYEARNPESTALAAKATKVMPGGNTRSSLWHAPFPLCMVGGYEARLVDADGHEYRDFLGEFTSGIFGHSPALLKQALIDAYGRGISLSSHNQAESELAAEICARFPSMDQLRFTNSGTEANIMALTAARMFTQRETILVFAGGYHGTGLTFGTETMPSALPFRFIVAPYNDMAAVQALVQQHGADLAAILVEPMLGAGGCVPADPSFLAGLQDIARAAGALFILDEVQTARLAPGGRQGLLGLKPDLTVLGKFFGGGLAFGCFGGRADILAMFDPRKDGSIGHAGTFNNNILAMSTGLAAVRNLLGADALKALNDRGDSLRNHLASLFEDEQVPFHVSGLGSLMNIHPMGATADVAAWRKLLFFDFLANGIYFAQRGLVVLSLPTSDEDVDVFVQAMKGFIQRHRALMG